MISKSRTRRPLKQNLIDKIGDLDRMDDESGLDETEKEERTRLFSEL